MRLVCRVPRRGMPRRLDLQCGRYAVRPPGDSRIAEGDSCGDEILEHQDGLASPRVDTGEPTVGQGRVDGRREMVVEANLNLVGLGRVQETERLHHARECLDSPAVV